MGKAVIIIKKSSGIRVRFSLGICQVENREVNKKLKEVATLDKTDLAKSLPLLEHHEP